MGPVIISWFVDVPGCAPDTNTHIIDINEGFGDLCACVILSTLFIQGNNGMIDTSQWFNDAHTHCVNYNLLCISFLGCKSAPAQLQCAHNITWIKDRFTL